MQTFVVRYGTFFAHASTTTTTITSIRTRTRTPRTTTNLPLGPLSIAQGQKLTLNLAGHIFTLLWAPFEFKMVNYWRHSEVLDKRF